MNARRTDAGGFAIIEVLVTLVLVLLGLLGAAGVLVRTFQGSMEAYQRTQALVLAEDMIDRINANRDVAECYAITPDGGASPSLGTDYNDTPACGAGDPAHQATAIQDLQQWSDLLKGAAETGANGTFAGAMIGARGCVSYNAATKTYSVTVAWQGIGATAAPPAELTCAAGAYGPETQRRVVTLSTQIASM